MYKYGRRFRSLHAKWIFCMFEQAFAAQNPNIVDHMLCWKWASLRQINYYLLLEKFENLMGATVRPFTRSIDRIWTRT